MAWSFDEINDYVEITDAAALTLGYAPSLLIDDDTEVDPLGTAGRWPTSERGHQE